MALSPLSNRSAAIRLPTQDIASRPEGLSAPSIRAGG